MLDYSKLSSKISNTEQKQATNEPKQEDYISYLQSKKKEKTPSSSPSNTKPKKEKSTLSQMGSVLKDTFSSKNVTELGKTLKSVPNLIGTATERFQRSLRDSAGANIKSDLTTKKATTGNKTLDKFVDQVAFGTSLGVPVAGMEGLAVSAVNEAGKVAKSLKRGNLPTTTIKKPALALPSIQLETQQALKAQPLTLPSRQQQVIERIAKQGKQSEGVIKPFGETPKPLPQTGTVAWTKEGKPILGLNEGKPIQKVSDTIPMSGSTEPLALPQGTLSGTKAIRGRTARGQYVDNVQATMAIGKKLGLDPQKDYPRFQQIYKEVSGVKGDYLQKALNEIGKPLKQRTSSGILSGLQRGRESQRMREIVGLNPLVKPSTELFPENYVPPSSVPAFANGLKTERGVANRISRTMQNREQQAFAQRLQAEQPQPQTEFSGMTGIRDSVRITGNLKPVAQMEQTQIRNPYATVNAQNQLIDRSPLAPTQTREPLTPPNMAGMREAIPQQQTRVELKGTQPTLPKTQTVQEKPVVENNKPTTSIPISEITNTKNAVTNAEKEINKASKARQKLVQTISEKGETPERLAKLNQLEQTISEYSNELKVNQQKLQGLDTRNINIQPNEYTKENVSNLVDEVIKNDNLSALNENIKNITAGFKKGYYGITDIYRVINKKIGSDSQVVRNILDNLDNAKNDNVTFIANELDELATTIQKGLGIEKGSKLSAAVQDFGERTIPSVDELKKLFPNDYKKIVTAEKWFRTKYDQYIDAVNEQIAMIYGGEENAKKLGRWVNKRDDYFHHFQELSGTGKFQQFIENLYGKIQGKVMPNFAKPKIKKSGYMMERKGGAYTSDAVGGFLKYLPEASYTMHIDKFSEVFRQLGKKIAEQTDQSPFLSKFLERFGDELSGVPTGLDRGLSDEASQEAINLLRTATNRTKTNAILGNFSSVLAQPLMIPNGIAQFGVGNTLKGLKRIVTGNGISKEVPFIKERYLDKKFHQFDTKLLEQPKKFFSWLLESMDEIGTDLLANAAYEKSLSEGIENPLQYASKETRKLVGGRGIGEQPIWQKQTWFQLLAPFSLEPIVDLRTKLGFLSDKQFGKLLTTLLITYGMNEAVQNVRGSRASTDFVNAVKEASAPDLSTPQRVGRIAGEALSSIPTGANIADIFVPETGIKWKGETISRKELFGQQDPTRFGTSSILVKPIVDASKSLASGNVYDASIGLLTTFITPYAGAQIKKTVEGAKAISQGGKIKNDKLYYPVERTPANVAKALLFGSSTTKEGQKFYNEPGVPRPLTKKETQKALSSNDLNSSYNQIKIRNKINGLKDEKVKVRKGLGKYSNYTENQKKLEYARINKDIEKLQTEETNYTK